MYLLGEQPQSLAAAAVGRTPCSHGAAQASAPPRLLGLACPQLGCA